MHSNFIMMAGFAGFVLIVCATYQIILAFYNRRRYPVPPLAPVVQWSLGAAIFVLAAIVVV